MKKEILESCFWVFEWITLKLTRQSSRALIVSMSLRGCKRLARKSLALHRSRYIRFLITENIASYSAGPSYFDVCRDVYLPYRGDRLFKVRRGEIGAAILSYIITCICATYILLHLHVPIDCRVASWMSELSL